MKDKTVIFSRVSSKEQELGYSLDSQKKLLTEYAEKNDFNVVKVFSVSESASGKKQREVFKEMMGYVLKQGIKNILCEKTDRLTRNFRDSVAVNEWINSSSERRVHFVKENVVLHRDSKSNEKFIWNIKISVAQYYIDNLSEEVKKGQVEKLSQGYLPSQPKFGYKSAVVNQRHIHEIDEDEAVYVVKMYELYSTGNHSLNVLKEILYKDGLRTRHGKKMCISRLAAILGDPFYYGALRWNRVVLDRGGEHTPLISKSLFDCVQLVLSGKGAPKQSKHSFAFKKMLTCGRCSGIMTGELQKGHIYYRCKGYGGCMVKSSIREDKLEEQIIGTFEILQKLTDQEKEQVRLGVLALHKEDSRYREKTLERLVAELKSLEGQRDMLYEDKLALRISFEKWQLKDTDYKNRIKKVEEDIAKQSDAQTSYFKVGSSLVELALKADKLYKSMTPEKRRELLKLIFSNLKVEDKKVLFSFTKPVERLVKRIEEKLVKETVPQKEKGVATQGSSAFSQYFYSMLCARQESNLRPFA